MQASSFGMFLTPLLLPVNSSLQWSVFTVPQTRGDSQVEQGSPDMAGLCILRRTTYFKFLLPYEMQARALNPRRPSKELQSDSKKAASESIDAPSGANVDDTLEQSSGTASEEDFIPLPQSEEPSQSPMEEDRGMMHTSDTPTLDAPGSAAEETAAAASRQGAIDGRPEAADGPAADLEPYAEAPASSAGIAEGKGCQEQFSKQGLSGADDLNRGADTIDFDGSESQEVIVIDDGHENVAS